MSEQRGDESVPVPAPEQVSQAASDPAKQPGSVPLPKTGGPASRALALVGILTLDDLRGRDLDALLDLHGVGPKAIRLLKAALAEHPEPPVDTARPGSAES